MLRPLSFLMILVFPAFAHADEGMWLFNEFPNKRVQAVYGATGLVREIAPATPSGG